VTASSRPGARDRPFGFQISIFGFFSAIRRQKQNGHTIEVWPFDWFPYELGFATG